MSLLLAACGYQRIFKLGEQQNFVNNLKVDDVLSRCSGRTIA
jgi:hypothetical protein